MRKSSTIRSFSAKPVRSLWHKSTSSSEEHLVFHSTNQKKKKESQITTKIQRPLEEVHHRLQKPSRVQALFSSLLHNRGRLCSKLVNYTRANRQSTTVERERWSSTYAKYFHSTVCSSPAPVRARTCLRLSTTNYREC